MGPYPPRVALVLPGPADKRSSSGINVFHTVRAGIDPGDNRIRPRVFRVVNVW